MARKKSVAIGGQAVIEGVMMRGERSMATAVRDENGKIVVESSYLKPKKSFLFKAPFLRGIFSFFGSMISGVGTLMRSGEVFDGEQEPSKAEKWFAKTFKVDVFSVVMVISVIIGIALSVGLFFFLPQLITSGIVELFKINTEANIGVKIGMNLLDGLIRMLIFVGYIALTSLLKDVRRTYMYHGAEHKTISCYEHDLPLTVENVQKMTTVHDRCGTTFMFITMVISVLIFSLTGWSEQLWVRLLIRLALIPVVSGVSYEILKLLAKFDNVFVRALKAPGLLLQKLTTRQPDDSMVEVAIVAFKTVLEMDANPDTPTQKFDTKLLKKKVVASLRETVKDEEEIKNIICTGMGVPVEDYDKITHIRSSRADLMTAAAKGEISMQELADKAKDINRAEVQAKLRYEADYAKDGKKNGEAEYDLKGITQTIKDRIKDCNADSSEAEWIICEVLGITRSQLALADKNDAVSEEDAKKMLRYADERATGKPLWQVIGYTEFYGYRIDVNEDVLCPRPETEELAEQAIKLAGEGKKVLDLCTGSGCIAIAVAKNTEAKITASDISEKALTVAESNAVNNAVADRIKFVRSDMFEKLSGPFDIIVSNPPYIPTAVTRTLEREVREHEPMTALDGGEDGMDFYREIAKNADAMLTQDGVVLLEVGEGQAQAVAQMFEGYRTSIIKDLQGVERIVKAERGNV